MAEMLDCPAVLSGFTRLFIDPNRDEADPTLVMKLSDGSIVPGNRHVDAAETLRRLELCYRPYHAAVEAAIARAQRPLLVSIHSFTPRLRGRPPRPWHVTALWEWDRATAVGFLEALRSDDPDLITAENEPYDGALEGDCLWRHTREARIPNVLIEIRNDLIADAAGQREWADRLARAARAFLATKKAAPEGAAEVWEDTIKGD